MQKPKAIDLFSGCGGLTLGLKQAGFQVVGAVEIDPLAVETYRSNHKRVFVWEKDISKISVSQVRKHLGLQLGQLDLLAGCPPCQGFSTMTTLNGRRGMNDARNDLVFQFLRFVRGLKPKAVMMENVPGLAKDARILKIAATLKRMGYHCKYEVLDAADYGVPQRRKRFIIVGGVGNEIPFGKAVRKKSTVRKAFARLSNNTKADLLHNLPEKRSPKVMERIRGIPKDGGSRFALGVGHQLDCHRKCDGFNDVYGRMSWEKVAPTITSGCINPSKGRFLHPEKHRAITLREAALLQGFPIGYHFSLRRGKYAAAEMIGNAVPPPFSSMQARSVIAFLDRLRQSAEK